MKTIERPLVLYDNDCHFCRVWVARWQQATGEKVEYVPYQEAANEFPEIPFSTFENAVQLFLPDGRRLEGAEAVYHLLSMGGWFGRVLLKLYKKVPLFRTVSNKGYRFIADNRCVSAKFTRALWGEDVLPPRYNISSWLFLRGLAVVYGIAFYSFWVQQAGLIGSNGILPFGNYFKQAFSAVGTSAFYQLPSLLWFWPSDTALIVVSCLGLVLSLMAFLGYFQAFCFVLMWAFYLSLVVTGQIFYAFQWDSLLLEVGFLAIFLAPMNRRAAKPAANSPKIARWLVIWLLFRFMLSSGVIKLTSGDPTWTNLTALNYHFFTQPLPNVGAWYAQLLPDWIKSTVLVGMFAIELVLPFFVFLPRRGRLIAFIGFIGLQLGIFLTGNYGYFLLLTAVLCLLLIDDLQWRHLLWWRKSEETRRLGEDHRRDFRFISRRVTVVVGIIIVFVSLVPFFATLRRPVWVLRPLVPVYELLMPFRSINGYGLFAMMTTRRLEIIVEGSDDGREWKTYVFQYKPGAVNIAPREAWFYMPRLDWQMWFAALGNAQQNPWFYNLLQRLLEGSPETLALFRAHDFHRRPPRFVRALTDSYTFTTLKQKRETGAWWDVEPAAIYVPEVTLAPTN